MFELDQYQAPAAEIGIFTQEAFKEELIRNKKFATRKTVNSIEYEVIINANSISVKIFSNISLVFIESGRRKGAKLPVKKTANGFELVDELKEWVEAVNFTGSYFLLARKISERGIKGVPITDLVLQRIGKDIDRMFVEMFKDIAVSTLVRQMKKILL